mmetsp:Transcript_41102/g.78484  ORF Transcript_41102/g.78484 Transcript_41102/m.78484 type:complete len:313 (+) Transcript_41102:785-1723(+)
MVDAALPLGVGVDCDNSGDFRDFADCAALTLGSGMVSTSGDNLVVLVGLAAATTVLLFAEMGVPLDSGDAASGVLNNLPLVGFAAALGVEVMSVFCILPRPTIARFSCCSSSSGSGSLSDSSSSARLRPAATFPFAVFGFDAAALPFEGTAAMSSEAGVCDLGKRAGFLRGFVFSGLASCTSTSSASPSTCLRFLPRAAALSVAARFVLCAVFLLAPPEAGPTRSSAPLARATSLGNMGRCMAGILTRTAPVSGVTLATEAAVIWLWLLLLLMMSSRGVNPTGVEAGVVRGAGSGTLATPAAGVELVVTGVL